MIVMIKSWGSWSFFCVDTLLSALHFILVTVLLHPTYKVNSRCIQSLNLNNQTLKKLEKAYEGSHEISLKSTKKQKELMKSDERHTNAQQAYEKILNIISHQGNANQNHKTSPHICQDGHHEKDKSKQVLARMWRTQQLCTTVGGNAKWCSCQGQSMEVPRKNPKYNYRMIQ